MAPPSPRSSLLLAQWDNTKLFTFSSSCSRTDILIFSWLLMQWENIEFSTFARSSPKSDLSIFTIGTGTKGQSWVLDLFLISKFSTHYWHKRIILMFWSLSSKVQGWTYKYSAVSLYNGIISSLQFPLGEVQGLTILSHLLSQWHKIKFSTLIESTSRTDLPILSWLLPKRRNNKLRQCLSLIHIWRCRRRG